ncbi:hypothetical protein CERSUDRAFT_99664 [Gelatoporia subvermispora B]|uniref:Uncharacterized protein n=1 Tax=Ceriporiopsis subvermispora (strain B) TaxID=914234 RepID=M2Q617_CERS8|nr:hypothetical protein CERSUDRAFT_99664 [Gelatoporia subvermispora B]
MRTIPPVLLNKENSKRYWMGGDQEDEEEDIRLPSSCLFDSMCHGNKQAPACAGPHRAGSTPAWRHDDDYAQVDPSILSLAGDVESMCISWMGPKAFEEIWSRTKLNSCSVGLLIAQRRRVQIATLDFKLQLVCDCKPVNAIKNTPGLSWDPEKGTSIRKKDKRKWRKFIRFRNKGFKHYDMITILMSNNEPVESRTSHSNALPSLEKIEKNEEQTVDKLEPQELIELPSIQGTAQFEVIAFSPSLDIALIFYQLHASRKHQSPSFTGPAMKSDVQLPPPLSLTSVIVYPELGVPSPPLSAVEFNGQSSAESSIAPSDSVSNRMKSVSSAVLRTLQNEVTALRNQMPKFITMSKPKNAGFDFRRLLVGLDDLPLHVEARDRVYFLCSLSLDHATALLKLFLSEKAESLAEAEQYARLMLEEDRWEGLLEPAEESVASSILEMSFSVAILPLPTSIYIVLPSSY